MRSLIVSMTLLVSACSMTPTLPDRPLPVAAAFPGTEHPGTEHPGAAAAGADRAASSGAQPVARPVAAIGWQSMFGDPRLQTLIELALEHNRDLRLAVLNVETVQTEYRIQRAARLPAVDASGGFTRQRAAVMGTGSPTTVVQQADLGVGISAFELDLWGRVRSLSESALARYLASDEGRQAAQASLVAAVADAYFAEGLAAEQAALATQTLKAWTEQRDLARQRRAAHQASALDVAQAESQVARAQADLEGRARDRERARNALVLLLGTQVPADGLPAPLVLERQPVLIDLPPGLPSELLMNRPDIRQAELNLRAANANIGAARAAFFPRISLTSSVGQLSPSVGSLFDADRRVWSFAPQISLPIFNAGRLRAELRLTELRTSSAVIEYERSIQTAFREVADGLAGSATFGRQIKAQQQVVAEESRRVSLSDQRYRAGVDGRLELLDAQRQLYTAQQALLDLRRDQIGNAVALYKALGGGLERGDAPLTAAPSSSVQ